MERRLIYKIVCMLIMLQTFAVGNTITAKGLTAKQVLDKTAAVITYKNGVSANFTISNTKMGTSKGVIYVKGNKWHAKIPAGLVWYDGMTQWTYVKANEEVNVTTPTKEQQSAYNPYSFINLYKKGYKCSLSEKGNTYVVTMIGQNSKKGIGEMIVVIDKATFTPTKLKMRQGETWTDIVISGFKKGNFSDAMFRFNSKDYPKAELIDLR